MNVRTFQTMAEAENFARDHLRYADGRYKNHLIDESLAVYESFESAGRYLVFWEGRLVRGEAKA